MANETNETVEVGGTGDADGCVWERASMFCAVSGTTPKEPVVTAKGVLYERSVIVKAIEVRRSDDDDKDDDKDDDDDECCARARLLEWKCERLERFGRRLTNGELARADVFNAAFLGDWRVSGDEGIVERG